MSNMLRAQDSCAPVRADQHERRLARLGWPQEPPQVVCAPPRADRGVAHQRHAPRAAAVAARDAVLHGAARLDAVAKHDAARRAYSVERGVEGVQLARQRAFRAEVGAAGAVDELLRDACTARLAGCTCSGDTLQDRSRRHAHGPYIHRFSGSTCLQSKS